MPQSFNFPDLYTGLFQERVTASTQQPVTGPPGESKYPQYMIYDCSTTNPQYTSPYTPYFVYPQHGAYPYPQYPRQQVEPQMVLPPIVYPDHVSPPYQAQTDPAQAASNQQETSNIERTEQEPAGAATDQNEADDLHFLDSVENKDDPNMPLTPLPAPLAPEVLPSAKKAAVMQNFGLDGKRLSLFIFMVLLISEIDQQVL